MKKRYLLAPGPTPVPPEVLSAMSEPIIHHRSPEFAEIMKEVLEGLKWLFQTLDIHRVTIECYSTNLRAIRFYKKVGFKQEGILREAVLIDGKYYDIISFGILKSA